MKIQNNHLLLVSLVMIYCTAVNTYALDKTASDILLEQHHSGNSGVNVPFEKRAIPLSLNGDLRMLARMLYASQRRRRVDRFASVRQQMSNLGKRSGGVQHDKDNDDPIRNSQDTSIRTEQQTQIRSTVPDYRLVSADGYQNVHPRSSLAYEDPEEFQKRSQRLSINGALSSLADMLAASGRRQLKEELAVNRQRLLKLGR
ncbi:uncharacterized protein LOC110450948 [Mizuhopecten yessoensis]|uniref:Egg laying hormone protein n=1 Tax=Mizuhopecten yessoensis TaxID=6573 RepID=A0A210QMT7_MIZYE|nr:uncharacterized protein LOC110450948 [Mizuhopecten yessoensis]AXN93484.1 egg laying hormone protein [Mizuhopecten yessoensis]OWF50045.1 hypothetical protein KP79_PYT23501 [Mizuhopecten yessoensis]